MKLTKQNVFDTVWDWFVVQDNPFSRLGRSNCCQYRKDRTPGCPVRCAVGLFIPDELYVPEEVEGSVRRLTRASLKDLNGSVRKINEHFHEIFEPNVCESTFLIDLQACHDHALDKEDFQRRMRAFASNYELTAPEPT